MGHEANSKDTTSHEVRPSQGPVWVSVRAEQKATLEQNTGTVRPEVADVQPHSALEPALEEGGHPTWPLTRVVPGPSSPSPTHRWEGTLPGSQGCCMCCVKSRPRGPRARHANRPQVLNGTDQAWWPGGRQGGVSLEA